jgi:hypothetical protein
MGGFGGGGFSAGGFGSSGFTGGGVESQEAAGTPRMDPSKGIVIEPEDQGQ